MSSTRAIQIGHLMLFFFSFHTHSSHAKICTLYRDHGNERRILVLTRFCGELQKSVAELGKWHTSLLWPSNETNAFENGFRCTCEWSLFVPCPGSKPDWMNWCLSASEISSRTACSVTENEPSPNGLTMTMALGKSPFCEHAWMKIVESVLETCSIDWCISLMRRTSVVPPSMQNEKKAHDLLSISERFAQISSQISWAQVLFLSMPTTPISRISFFCGSKSLQKIMADVSDGWFWTGLDVVGVRTWSQMRNSCKALRIASTR